MGKEASSSIDHLTEGARVSPRTEAPASGSRPPRPGRGLAVVAGVAVAAFAVARYTLVFEGTLGWVRTLGPPEALVGPLAVVALAALAVLVWQGRARRGRSEAPVVAPPPAGPSAAAFPAHHPYPFLEASTDGAVCYANPAAEALLAEDGLAHPILHYLPGIAADLRSDPSQRVVQEVSTPGAVYELHAAYVAEHDRVWIYLHDVTEARRAREALRKSEEKFARVFRSGPIPISISKLSDGRFIDVNDSFVRLLGYTDRHAVIGRTATDVGMWVHPGQRAYLLARLAEDDRVVHRQEAQVYTTDGTVRSVLVSMVALEVEGEACVLSTLLDVTEHRQAEAGLEVLKAFYENTLKELPIQVAVLDAQARFFYLNPEAIRDDEMRLWMVGKTSVDYAHALGLDPAPYERRHAWLLDVIRQKKIGQLEETLPSRSGEIRHLLRVATPVLDHDGEVIYVVGYGMDITDRKAFEHKLLEAKNAAEEMARLKSAFVANISHEVRTPLTAILGFATVLSEELGGEHRELAELVWQSGERLLETLNSVLDLARLEANAIEVDPRPLDLEEEVLAAARLFRPLAEKKGLAFDLELPHHTMRAQLDRACLHRILSNLLSNAIKFTDEGEVRLVLRPLAREVQIQVQDTGIGIDTAFQPHLFEEFKQESMGLARTHTGSGLGLAITRHLVERMHGHIEVESAKGEGTTFTVTFPTVLPRPAYAAEAGQEQLNLFEDTETVES